MKERHEYVRDWLVKAGNDLKVAQREMRADDPASDAVCFHFPQFVEKMLKTWLIMHAVENRPTHNLEILIKSCASLDASFLEIGEVDLLTPYAVSIRYADDFYLPTPDEMHQAAKLARKAGIFIKGKLEALGVPVTIQFEELEQ